jgi:hypothetical protein
MGWLVQPQQLGWAGSSLATYSISDKFLSPFFSLRTTGSLFCHLDIFAYASLGLMTPFIASRKID